MKRGHTYETDDALLYVSKGTSRFVSSWHVRFYRYFPKLYNKGYQYAEEHPASFDESSAACRILRRGCKRLRATILAGGYDAVVCVHLFPALMLTFIQQDSPLRIKTMFIATDYTASPSCDRMRLDTCVIPDIALTDTFVKTESIRTQSRRLAFRCAQNFTHASQIRRQSVPSVLILRTGIF